MIILADPASYDEYITPRVVDEEIEAWSGSAA